MKSSLFYLMLWLSVCVATLGGYWFWYSTVADKSVAVASLENQINTRTEASVRIAAVRTALSEIAGDESIVQGYFVPETAVVSFINNLEARARAQKAVMKVLSVSTAGTTKQPMLVLTLSIDGTFDSVMRTVGAIEYAPYNLSISKLSLGKQEKGNWRADIGLMISSVPAVTATSTPAAPAKVSSTNIPYEYF
jgi:hypothetical protein